MLNTASNTEELVTDAEARSLANEVHALAQKAVEAWTHRGLSIALAESCTGGLLASEITAVPGASQALNSSTVVYQTQAKSSLLGLPSSVVERFGPVSREVTEALAKAAREKNDVPLGLAVTGWAGPSGGTQRDPVGTCFVALSRLGKITCIRRVISGDRQTVRQAAVAIALQLALGDCAIADECPILDDVVPL